MVKDFRTFALSRILDVKISNRSFPAKDFNLRQFFNNNFSLIDDGKTYSVKILFYPDQAPYVTERSWHPTQKIEKKPDGSVVLSLETRNLFEIKRWILSWGFGAKVLHPPELIKGIKAELKKMVNIYD